METTTNTEVVLSSKDTARSVGIETTLLLTGFMCPTTNNPYPLNAHHRQTLCPSVQFAFVPEQEHTSPRVLGASFHITTNIGSAPAELTVRSWVGSLGQLVSVSFGGLSRQLQQLLHLIYALRRPITVCHVRNFESPQGGPRWWWWC